MRVVIAGGHGKIALRLARLLSDRGDEPVGLIRDLGQAPDLAEVGCDAVLCDLEQVGVDELAGHVVGADAVVFAAGAGPGSGADRKDTVDRAAAELLADAARKAGVRQYLLISSMGLDQAGADGVDPVFAAYLVAKKAAEDAIRVFGLDWTILRPGRLTDDPGTGRVRLGAPPIHHGAVSRDDVAAVLAELLTRPGSARHTLELVGGADPVADAVYLAVGG
ncbi:MAG TPA: NAD(P)H-binding protein [Pseudonocardiaceae bacterium]|nr:NAD(P)H-binding protein [Pseudonocardiaceae bacterium]